MRKRILTVRPEENIAASCALRLYADEDGIQLELGTGRYPGSHRVRLNVHEQLTDEAIAAFVGEAEMSDMVPSSTDCGPAWIGTVDL
jgi:hypothetical protein